MIHATEASVYKIPNKTSKYHTFVMQETNTCKTIRNRGLSVDDVKRIMQKKNKNSKK
jgi:hypothetical protein